MIEKPKIITTPEQTIAIIHVTVPRNEIQKVMGPGIVELNAAVRAQGVAITGPWFTHHLRISADTFDFEICLPVAEKVAAVGRVQPGLRPAMKVARTVYQGPYEGLGKAWGEFKAWIEGNGHVAREDFYEIYSAGPETSKDPALWRTEFVRPLCD